MSDLTQADRTFVRDRPFTSIETKLLAALEEAERRYSMFTKQIYELLTQVIIQVGGDNPIAISGGEIYLSRRRLVTALADILEADNPVFDRSRFFLESGEVYDLGRGEANE